MAPAAGVRCPRRGAGAFCARWRRSFCFTQLVLPFCFSLPPPPLASPTLPRLSEPAAILSRAALRLAQIRLAIGVAHLVAAASSDTGAAYKRADSSAGPYKCSRAAARGATGAALSTRSGGQSQSKSRSRSREFAWPSESCIIASCSQAMINNNQLEGRAESGSRGKLITGPRSGGATSALIGGSPAGRQTSGRPAGPRSRPSDKLYGCCNMIIRPREAGERRQGRN